MKIPIHIYINNPTYLFRTILISLCSSFRAKDSKATTASSRRLFSLDHQARSQQLNGFPHQPILKNNGLSAENVRNILSFPKGSERYLNLRGGSTFSPWTTCSDMDERRRGDGTFLTDHELSIKDLPFGRDPWSGAPHEEDPYGVRQKEPGFWSTDIHAVEQVYGKAYCYSAYRTTDHWCGGLTKEAFEEHRSNFDVSALRDDNLDNSPANYPRAWRGGCARAAAPPAASAATAASSQRRKSVMSPPDGIRTPLRGQPPAARGRAGESVGAREGER